MTGKLSVVEQVHGKLAAEDVGASPLAASAASAPPEPADPGCRPRRPAPCGRAEPLKRRSTPRKGHDEDAASGGAQWVRQPYPSLIPGCSSMPITWSTTASTIGGS